MSRLIAWLKEKLHYEEITGLPAQQLIMSVEILMWSAEAQANRDEAESARPMAAA